MPGRKEQNQRDLKKACANYYQLDTFFKGIGKTVNESKNCCSENQSTSPQYLRILQIVPRIYHAQVKRTIVYALNIS